MPSPLEPTVVCAVPKPTRPGLHVAVVATLVAALFVLAQARGTGAERADRLRTADPTSIGDAGGGIDAQPKASDELPSVFSPGSSSEAPQSTIIDADATISSTLSTAPTAGTASADGATAPVADPAYPAGVAAPTLDPSVLNRPVPQPVVASSPPMPGPWDSVTHTTPAGYVSTEVGCARDASAGGLDAFFAERIGPVVGADYQHVFPLPDGRFLWLFQDTFIDHSGTATTLGAAGFAHNAAMIQNGACFTLLHRGTSAAPTSFEPGIGERTLSRWFWPMGGEVHGNQLFVFWAQMQNDGYQPGVGDGLGWHPAQTWLAVYDATTLQRQAFRPAVNPGVAPIYGYAVASQGDFTYLFGNTFEQNLVREGGFSNGPHSATSMWLARVPVGQFGAAPEYRTADGWSADATQAVPIAQRYWVENPMQPRYMDGQWVSVTKVDGYWGEQLAVDVATDPWGPWTTVDVRGLVPRGGDPLMNTYHAQLMPWLADGALVVSISQNARDMTRDAYPVPARYRIGFFPAALVRPPPPPPETTTSTTPETTIVDSTSSTTDSSTSTTAPGSTTSQPATSTSTPTSSSSTSSSSTSTTVPTSTTSSTTTSSPTTSTSPGSTTSSSTVPPSTSSSTSTSSTSTTVAAPAA